MSLRFTDMSVHSVSSELETDWRSLIERYSKCELCWLSTHRRNVVFGRGHLPAHVVILGEGPGRTEDREAAPFVGSSGFILRQALERIAPPSDDMALRWFIANLVGCRPCDGKHSANRAPHSSEVKACRERLLAMLDLARPKVVVLLGKATQAAYYKHIQSKCPNIPTIDLAHPSFILRRGGLHSQMCSVWIAAWVEGLDKLDLMTDWE